jgi:hypothetical protein
MAGESGLWAAALARPATPRRSASATVRCSAPMARTRRPRNRWPALTSLSARTSNEAIEVASKHPMAWRGMIELRPFWEDDAD